MRKIKSQAHIPPEVPLTLATEREGTENKPGGGGGGGGGAAALQFLTGMCEYAQRPYIRETMHSMLNL